MIDPETELYGSLVLIDTNGSVISEPSVQAAYDSYGDVIARLHEICAELNKDIKGNGICVCSEPIGSKYCRVSRIFCGELRFLFWVDLTTGDMIGDTGTGLPDHSYPRKENPMNVWDEEPIVSKSPWCSFPNIVFSGFTYDEMAEHAKLYRETKEKYYQAFHPSGKQKIVYHKTIAKKYNSFTHSYALEA